MTQRVKFSLDLKKSSQPSLKKKINILWLQWPSSKFITNIYFPYLHLKIFKKYSHGFKKSQTSHPNTGTGYLTKEDKHDIHLNRCV